MVTKVAMPSALVAKSSDVRREQQRCRHAGCEAGHRQHKPASEDKSQDVGAPCMDLTFSGVPRAPFPSKG
jgi:hypothetical protein